MNTEQTFLDSLLKENDTVVFACSGGPDSMCLLTLLYNIYIKKNITLICAHVNHNKRKESKEEYQFVKQYCEERNIIFEGFEITSYNQGNFHHQAHQKRREFFFQVIKKYHANYMMTAHHGDDLVETILMRLTRGSSMEGYFGFTKIKQEDGYQLIRPLITATKAQIKEYMDEKHIPYVIDFSNEKDTYTRNRYRHKILPFLKEENQNVHLKFLQFGESICRINEFLVKFIENALTDCIKNDTLLIVEIKKQDILIQQEIIKNYLSRIYKDDIVYLKEKHVKEILSLIKNHKSNATINLPQKYVAIKSYDTLKIKKSDKNIPIKIELNDEVKTDYYRIYQLEETEETGNHIIRLNRKEIVFPLLIRNRKPKDQIMAKNLNGHQKIKQIFIDKKIPREERDKWPILVDANDQILWIPDLKKSKFDKEKNEKYDIIYKYEISKEKKNAKKK